MGNKTCAAFTGNVVVKGHNRSTRKATNLHHWCTA
jgi:hypothetical protein